MPIHKIVVVGCGSRSRRRFRNLISYDQNPQLFLNPIRSRIFGNCSDPEPIPIRITIQAGLWIEIRVSDPKFENVWIQRSDPSPGIQIQDTSSTTFPVHGYK